MSRAEGFWGRRRAAVKAEAAAEHAALEERAQAGRDAAMAEMPDAELLAELDLPDPDTLKMGDDFAAFMAKAVPAHLRRRALRKLWTSNPVLACVDGLNDYDGDFTNGGKPFAPIRTNYRVGQGMLKHIEEMARRTAADDATTEIEDMPAEIEVAEVDEPVTAALAAQENTETEAQTQDSAQPEAPALPAAPRRMRFRNEETAA